MDNLPSKPHRLTTFSRESMDSRCFDHIPTRATNEGLMISVEVQQADSATRRQIVRSLRKRLSMSQQEFGQFLRVSQPLVAQWESGYRHVQDASWDHILKSIQVKRFRLIIENNIITVQ